MSTFEEEFIAKIANALGVPAELLSKDYDACLSPEERAARNWWIKYEQLQRFRDAEIRSIFWNAFLYAAIWTVESYCGYNPQKLLPYHKPNYDLWDRETLAQIVAGLPVGENFFADFFPKAGDPQRYYIEGGHFDMFAPGVFDPDTDTICFEHPPARMLAPYVKPNTDPILLKNVRLSYPHLRERRYEHKLAVMKVDIDYGPVEMRTIARLMEDQDIRGIVFDFDMPGGEIYNEQAAMYAFGTMHAKKRKAEVAPKKKLDYLKHDPTKQNRRRRRK